MKLIVLVALCIAAGLAAPPNDHPGPAVPGGSPAAAGSPAAGPLGAPPGPVPVRARRDAPESFGAGVKWCHDRGVDKYLC
ncbi:hypothetical protein ONE63_005148 [Megalurothrips usitatus]|uniref:Uncharacterized protein n=1 Tax=Megalurothrips usitatus TaxID=439358 RepID=A0AAV7XXP5_9NEOP|nr:hypothetical protein ONE63_005148 [Megalurothrips usitatus]